MLKVCACTFESGPPMDHLDTPMSSLFSEQDPEYVHAKTLQRINLIGLSDVMIQHLVLHHAGTAIFVP